MARPKRPDTIATADLRTVQLHKAVHGVLKTASERTGRPVRDLASEAIMFYVAALLPPPQVLKIALQLSREAKEKISRWDREEALQSLEALEKGIGS